MYIRTSLLVSFETTTTLVCWPIMQHCIHSIIQTSTRIIILCTELFPKKRRGKRYKERYFKNLIPTRIQECFQCFYMQSSSLQINSTYRINSTTRNSKEVQQLQGSFRTGSLPAVPPVHPSILHSKIKFQGSYSTSRLPVILPGRNSILHGSQPSCSPSSNSQAQPT